MVLRRLGLVVLQLESQRLLRGLVYPLQDKARVRMFKGDSATLLYFNCPVIGQIWLLQHSGFRGLFCTTVKTGVCRADESLSTEELQRQSMHLLDL